jgi:hypothetical protein
VRNDLLARDATCAAGVRARNAATIADDAPDSAEQDIRQIRALIAQADAALVRAVADGDLQAELAAALDGDLAMVDSRLSDSALDAAGNSLIQVCNALAGGQ